MRVSFNEYRYLLKQVLEACGFASGEREQAANQLIHTFVYGLTDDYYLSDYHLAALQQPGKLTLGEASQTRLQVDAGGGSLIRYAAPILDLLLAHSRSGRATRLNLSHAKDAVYAVYALMGVQVEREQRVFVFCDQHTVSACYTQPGKAHPVLQQWQNNQQTNICLFAVRPYGQQGLKGWLQALTEIEFNVAKQKTDLDQRYQSALENGIVLDDELWQRLKKKELEVLVPTTEQSRRGAGQ